jgi:hypothetical protein
VHHSPSNILFSSPKMQISIQSLESKYLSTGT